MKLISFLTAVLFVITAVLVLLGVNLAHIITNRDQVKALALQAEPLLLDVAPQVAADMLQSQAQEQGLPPIPVDTAVLAEAIQMVLPPEWMSSQMETAVDDVFDGLEAGTPTDIVVELDAAPLLARVRGEPGQQAMTLVVESLPPCAEGNDSAALTVRGVAVPDCLPPDLTAAEAAQLAHDLLVETLDQNPQLVAEAEQLQVPLLTLGRLSPKRRFLFEWLHWFFLVAQGWAGFLWLIPAGLLLLIWLLVVRSWADWGRWWGWPLLVTAVLTFLAAWSMPLVITRWGTVFLPQI
ncbi:MAG: hypothetical protein P8183_22800, partial [Anaerolineae bacterium]